MNYARTENNTVAQVLRVDPSTIFDESFAALFQPCSEDVQAGWLWDGSAFAAPPALPVIIPQAVTMRQARLALLAAGKLAGVNAAIAGMTGAQGDAARIEWEFSSEVERGQPLVMALGPALGMSEAQLDALFVAAAAL